MTPQISQSSIDMIVGFEIGSAADYDPHIAWPGGASGPTAGIGYDLGYETKLQIMSDWSPHLPSVSVNRMAWCAGIKGDAARASVAQLRDIIVSLAAAEAVFYGRDVARYTDMTVAAFPNAALLSPTSLGALVSLVFNRGTDTARHLPDTRLEMRQIGAALAAKQFGVVPSYIRAMKRLWEGKNLNGLLARRDTEAELFEAGLRVDLLRAVAPIAAQATVQSDADRLMDQFNPGVPK